MNAFLVCCPLYCDDVCLVSQQTRFWSYLQVGYCGKCSEAEVFPEQIKLVSFENIGDQVRMEHAGGKIGHVVILLTDVPSSSLILLHVAKQIVT